MSAWQDELDSASRGDPDAIAALLERHLPRLRAFVRLRMDRELRRKESASDLVQSACREVLLRVDRYRYRSEANFRSWLFTTALRKIQDRVDYYRADKRNIAREIEADQPDEIESLARVYADFNTPSAQLEMKDRVARIEAAFDRLSEEHREVITLTRIVGLPHREVAAAMGRSEAASRMLLYRALAAFATALGGGE
jgi:RNA polymerase sigma-70 factor (ECF subfamily)